MGTSEHTDRNQMPPRKMRYGALNRCLGEPRRRRQPLQADPDLPARRSKPEQRQVKYVRARPPIVADQIDHQRIQHIPLNTEFLCYHGHYSLQGTASRPRLAKASRPGKENHHDCQHQIR